jgi:hypothetical protein
MATTKKRKRDPALSNPVLYSPRERLVREGEQEAAAQARHSARTRYRAPYHWAICTCRWIGPKRGRRELAERDAENHEREVTM